VIWVIIRRTIRCDITDINQDLISDFWFWVRKGFLAHGEEFATGPFSPKL
jgi:hypothetical protein